MQVQNWFGSIVSSPQVVVEAETVDEIVAIMKDSERYPSPVRAVGIYNRLVIVMAVTAIRGDKTAATSQLIRYPQPFDNSRYTFSIWAFPEEWYIDCLSSYFEFSRRYHKETGYRVNLLSVSYRIKADQSSLFSYSFDGDVMTFDPVSTGNPGWTEFLKAYNDLCHVLGGVPLFNQTNFLTRPMVDKAFGDRLKVFDTYRRRYDPADRLVNPYFKELLARPVVAKTRAPDDRLIQGEAPQAMMPAATASRDDGG